ncbi:MAG: bacillithiol biosynthesis cysteine-adding enzyme BshC [Ginsengibacter sp.]
MSRQFQSTNIPYSQTGKFSKIVLDYVSGATELKEFYEHPVDLQGIKSAITERKKFKNNRKILVDQLTLQYEGIAENHLVKANINSLLSENTFTICTAHQPNIFTGHLYFIYKILHVIKIAKQLKDEIPECNFVPVFFVGSEDADLEELNHIELDGHKYEWNTKQTGAVGRMTIDAELIKLIDQIAGRLSVEKYGEEIISLVRNCYVKNRTIGDATFLFVHELFKEYGLLVLQPDNAVYKNEMIDILEDDIFNHTSSKIVEKTSEKLSANYKAQAYPRAINLFYLKDNIRKRFEVVGEKFMVLDTDIVFTKEEIKSELKNYPERFSPNVILRGAFQEIILPNIAFVGGGGELAYWLQLKDIFKQFSVPFPMLVVRNSFLLVEKKYALAIQKLNISTIDLFKKRLDLLSEIVKNETESMLDLQQQKSQIAEIYDKIKMLVNPIDPTLVQHVSALETKQQKLLGALEKKMMRAEKKKYSVEEQQLTKLYDALFPGGGLQERTENFMLFYSKWGKDFIKLIYENSLVFEQDFCIIEQKD